MAKSNHKRKNAQKMHTGAKPAKKAAGRNKARLNDPDFAGKKAVQNAKNKSNKPAKSSVKITVEGAEKPLSKVPRRKNTKLSDPDFAGKKAVKGTSASPIILEQTKVAVSKKQAVKQPDTPQEPAPQKPKKHHRLRSMPIALRIILSIILLAAMAVIFTWFILLRQNMNDAEATTSFIQEKPQLFVYSTLVVFFLMAVVSAITWRVFATIGISFAFFSIITFIHMQKFTLRAAPLLPEDFMMAGQAGNIASFVNPGDIVRLVIGSILVIAGSFLLQRYARKVLGDKKKDLPAWRRYKIVPRITLGLMALAGLAITVSPAIQHKSPKWMEGLEYTAWSQTENYEHNGFVIGFLYNMAKKELKKPDGYSEEAIDKIAKKYEAEKAADDTERKPLNQVAQNVIIILDETFYDPELLNDYYAHTGGDVVPNLHRIFREYPSGYMYSTEYGGGTANVEFEVLTGLSNFWAQSIPYQDLLPKLNSISAIPGWSKEAGFSTMAIHSYDGSMYKRNIVYPLMGYSSFKDESEFRYKRYEGKSWYINDESTFQEVIDQLEASSAPQMIGVVTMQNHGPYWAPYYDEMNYLLTNANNWLLEMSMQSVHDADEYLGNFLKKLDKLNEDTVVLWFGDHHAGVIDLYINSDKKEDRDIARLVPYFIYANFDIESKYTTQEIAEMNEKLGFELPAIIRGVDLPTTTPNCLLNTMYDTLNIEKPAMMYLVGDVCAETPVLARAYWEKNNPKETSALKDYELVNYDLLGGKRYWK